MKDEMCKSVPEHGHGEPLGKHVHDEGPQGVQAGQLVGQVHPAGLLSELEEQDPCIYGGEGAMREIQSRVVMGVNEVLNVG